MWNIKWNFLKNCPVNLPYWFWEAAPLCWAKRLKMISFWIHISCRAHRFKWGSSDIMGQEIRPSLCFFWGVGLINVQGQNWTADYGCLWHYGNMFITTNLKFTYSPSSFFWVLKCKSSRRWHACFPGCRFNIFVFFADGFLSLLVVWCCSKSTMFPYCPPSLWFNTQLSLQESPLIGGLFEKNTY